MTKLAFFLTIIGVLFLILYWIVTPVMGAALTVVSLPFSLVSGILIYQKHKLKKEYDDMVTAFQIEKEDIIKEIQKKEKRRQEQSDIIRGFSKELSVVFNKEQLLRIIVQQFSQITQSSSGESQCFLLVNDPGTEEFTYEIGYNLDRNSLRAMNFSAKDDVIQTVVKSKKISTYVSDIFGGDSNIRYFWKEDRLTYLSQLGSLALIPLVLEDNVWGIIVIFCGEDAAARIKNEEGFILLLVAQAAIALGSAIHRGLASVDRLTQLYNRTFLQKRMLEEIEFCNRQLLPLSLMMIDIDFFKEVNDTYGHQEGDMVLKKISQIITNNVRLTDICARYGGEEFVVVLPGIAEIAGDKFSIAERLRKSVESADFFVGVNKRIRVTVSVGVSVRRAPDDQDLNMENLIKKADELLYKAKKEGRNRVCYSPAEA
ncbi:MAG: sensor domain-containing diguanylate cyclase [Candidatus Omnitrophica bacterium]|nr:sensor domain-containing diguanylate cyclase [Candidatus Omnitrophota bacterium]